MRCLACDRALSEKAVRLKMPKSGEYWDLCSRCLSVVQQMLGRPKAGDKHERRVVEQDAASVFLLAHGFDGFGNRRTEPAQPDG